MIRLVGNVVEDLQRFGFLEVLDATLSKRLNMLIKRL